MWPFSRTLSPTDNSADRAAAFNCQLERYAFLVADRCILFMDEAGQDQLIKLLYSFGKSPVVKPDKP